MEASLRWLEETVGYETVYGRIAALTQRCRELLADLPGSTIHSPAHHVGLTAFSLAGLDPQATVDALAQEGIFVRTIPHWNWIRVATGFYNTEADLLRLRDALLALQHSRLV